MQSPELFIAFLAGLFSFLSPCVLPLVPAYIGYLGGSVTRTAPAPRPARVPVAASQAPVMTAELSVAGAGSATLDRRPTPASAPPSSPRPARGPVMKAASSRWIVLVHAFVFVLGFTLVFAIIGGLVGSLRDVLLGENPWLGITNRRLLQYIMGVLLTVFGLHMIGLINIPWLNYEKRLGDKLRPSTNLSYIRSFLIGLGFGLGWTPCIGPQLGLIFTMSLGGQQGQAILPFLAYSIGLGIPFMLTALAMGRISSFLKKLTRKSYSVRIGNWKAIDRVNIVSLVSGGLLVFMGILIFFDLVTLLAPPITGLDGLIQNP
jgi:cytochrome c-type biogenesis protein